MNCALVALKSRHISQGKELVKAKTGQQKLSKLKNKENCEREKKNRAETRDLQDNIK